MKDKHVQMLLDVVVPEGEETFMYLAELIQDINSFLHRKGVQESVWAVRLPEDRS